MLKKILVKLDGGGVGKRFVELNSKGVNQSAVHFN